MSSFQIRELSPPLACVDLAEAVRDDDHPVFLDSGMQVGAYGEHSFVTCRPEAVLRSRGRMVELTAGGERRSWPADPFTVLESMLAERRREPCPSPVPLTGGAIGYFAYDLGRLIERLPADTIDDLATPDLYVGFYGAAYGYVHATGRGYLCGDPGSEAWEALELAIAVADRRSPAAADRTTGPAGKGLRSSFTPEAYRQAVTRSIEYIAAGDIFQVNLSQRFDCELLVPPWELYRRLREVNPAPFAAYLGFEELQVVSASPERFLLVADDQVQTRPIKGTRPRGATPAEDEALAEELLTSEKDRAELTMIIDLERNDLGRVCTFGSVRVPELIALESYPTVHHLVSTVVGRLAEGRGQVDLLRATFPGGSITGAPKVRAMEIIEELEPTRRGVYTGSIGYLGYDGTMDLSIVIRTVVVRKGRAYFQVGGGIVADSQPQAEHVETLDKGRALARALGVEKEAPFDGSPD